MSAAQGKQPPVPPNMPAPIRRSRRGEAPRESFFVEIETVTPVLGGAPAPRQVDQIDVIRVPTIRGHLRFWWRALQSQERADPKELAAAEAAIWGRADAAGGRSQVELSAEVRRPSRTDATDVGARTPGAYALWPARGTDKEPPAPRYPVGLRFRLTISAPEGCMRDARDATRAWILFGGYGSRTRRGAGSLTVAGGRQMQADWLPSVEYPEELESRELQEEFRGALRRLFGRDVFAAGLPTLQVPLLSGATLLIGNHFPQNKAQQAWLEALGWLRDFRQQPGFAREAGRPRPGRSRWPEADKLRHLTGCSGHPPRYTDRAPAWPRAEFGLPILGKFQGRGEPPDFQLTWQTEEERPDSNERIMDRLASPVMVKALPTRQGYRSCALWLSRAAPPGELVAVTTETGSRIPGSEAPFGYMGSPADMTIASRLGAPHAGKPTVKAAFIDWVAKKDGVVRIAP